MSESEAGIANFEHMTMRPNGTAGMQVEKFAADVGTLPNK